MLLILNHEHSQITLSPKSNYNSWIGALSAKPRHILNDIRSSVQDMQGVIIDIQEENSGPSANKPIQINLSGDDPVWV